jgi:hypothetical protein
MEQIQNLPLIIDNVKSQLDLESIIAGAFTIIMAIIYLFNHQSKRIEQEAIRIEEKHMPFQNTINTYLEEIKSKSLSSPSLYKIYLHQLIIMTDHFFGKFTFFNIKTFFLVLKITFLYSFSFFLIGWLLGSSGKLGEIPLLPDDNEKRFFIGLFFISIVLWVSRYVFDFIYSMIYFFIKKDIKSALKYLILSILVIFITSASSFLIFDKSEFGFGAIIVTMAVSFAIAIRFNVIVAFVLLLIVSWSLMALMSKDFEIVTLLLFVQYKFFGFILPLLNAFFDYLSIYFTRYFAKKIYYLETKREILFDLTIDALIAMSLAYFQYLALFKIMSLYNLFFIDMQELMLPIQIYKEMFLNNPFDKDILWITLMIVSTFIPTFIHILLVISAIVTKQINITKMNSLIANLENINPNDEVRKVEKISKDLAYYNLEKEINRSIIIGFGLVLLSVFALIVLIKKVSVL